MGRDFYREDCKKKWLGTAWSCRGVKEKVRECLPVVAG